jgi:hypothetical protein
MDVVYTHYRGVDVHKREVVACLVSPRSDGPVQKTIRRSSTMTDGLEALRRGPLASSGGHTVVALHNVTGRPATVYLATLGLDGANTRHILTDSPLLSDEPLMLAPSAGSPRSSGGLLTSSWAASVSPTSP